MLVSAVVVGTHRN